MNIVTKLDFLPGKKTLLSFGLAALTFVGHALATLLLDQFAPGNAAAEMLIDQVAAYGYAASGIGAVYGLSAKALRKMGVSKAAPIALAVLGLGLATAPAHAVQPIPPIGCGGGSCSLYVFDVGWPGGIGVNAVEFVRFRVGADLPMVVQDTYISPIGGVCLIPKVGPALGILCPQPASE